MPKYRVVMVGYVDTTVVVEAASETDALERAEDTFESPTLCWSCNDEMELGDAWTALNDDGKPYGITLED